MDSVPQAQPSNGTSRASYSWDDFVGLPDDDRRELIDGELIEVEVPTKLHEHIVAEIQMLVRLWSKANGGLALGSGYKVQISDSRGVLPDVQYFGPTNPGAQSLEDDERARPDLAVEVISPSSRTYDQATKLKWYASIGVPEYWLIDPDARTIQRFQLTGERYVVAEALSGNDVLTPDTFPGLVIPLADLWSLPVARK
jgi:Uma2 family endonuclease